MTENKRENNSKRKIKNLLPAIFQTPINEKFFSSSVDHVFQPQEVEEYLGYIGKVTSWYDHLKDFYISEKSKERQFHQLSSLMICKNKENNDYEKILFYEDLINYLRFKGGIVNDHQRLFECNYYSWCPPIDLDKFMNYKNYYWVPLGPKPVEIEVPTNLDSVIGLENYSINNNGQLINFSSGLRIKPKNDINSYYNGRVFIVEGVGRGIILVEDVISAYGWDLNPWDTTLWDEIGDLSFVPDYIVMERGARDRNQWSLANRWFHRSVITNFFDPNLIKIRATRPIIEFERDLELWNYGLYNRGRVDFIVDNCDDFYNLINGRKPGMPTNPPSTPGGLPTIGCGIEVDEPLSNWPLSNLGYSQIYYTDSKGNKIQLRDGLTFLLPNDRNLSVRNKILKITGIKDFNEIIFQVVNNGINISGEPEYDERVVHKTISGKTTVYRYNGAKWVEAQTKKTINQPPLFKLYDTYGVSLDDENKYPSSDFKGNKIFSYKEDDKFPLDKVLNLRVKKNKYGKFLFENNIATERYHYIDPVTKDKKSIFGFYFYKIFDHFKNKIKFSNNWHLVPNRLHQPVVFVFDNNKDQKEFVLEVEPSLPLSGRESVESKSLIVKINNRELKEGTDFTYDNFQNKIILNNPLSEGEILHIYVISDDVKNKKSGIYDIPLNLQANPNNDEVEEISQSELFEHFYNNIKNQKNISGNIFSLNNYRDTKKERFYGNKILQHEAPLLKLMLIASDRDLDLVDAIRYVRREYVRFRNKFVKKISSMSLSSNNPEEWFERALKEINLSKNEEFPFRYSGSGESLTTTSFPTFIPPTPAYLGLTRVYEPKIYIDDTYSTPLEVLRCHDGSLFPTFGDFRDQVMLYYEQRIYDSIPEKFKNDYLPPISEFDVIPGKFRKTDYTIQEINSLLQNSFELWLVDNGITFLKNNYLETLDEKSINYTSSKDYSGESVIGSWRSLFKWFYDTDTPHLTPWEMLGFGKKPDWWDSEYGPPPYTSGNFKLWNDLKDGYIRQGPRKGYDKRFKRPDLLNIIPTDSYGNLKSPLEIGLVLEKPSDIKASKDWEFGEYGPIETIWRKSSEYLYDLSIMLFLAKPAKFVELNWDNLSSEYIFEGDSKQFIHRGYEKRTRNSEEIIHGESKEILKKIFSEYDIQIYDNVIRRYGIQQFIFDYLRSKGKDITLNFGNLIRNLNVTLGYRASGFVDSNYTFVESESFGRITKDNYKIKIYKSNSLKEVFYGGVIIEKTSLGYKVYGYDVINPYFNIIPSDTSGRKVRIGIGTKPVNINNWLPKTRYQKEDVIILNDTNKLYVCIEDHLSTEIFDPSKWREIRNLPKDYEISAIKYLDGIEDRIERIKYGHEFYNHQEVFNFLIEYERFLKREGFVFDNYNDQINDVMDFTWSGKEFLSWVLSNPVEGEIISLSPLAEKVKFETDFGMIAPVEETIKSVYSILNRSGFRIDPKNTVITRYENGIEIIPYNLNDRDSLIYAARLYVVSVEHVYIFDNKTVFGDIIYDPLFNIKIDRLRINLVRVSNWKGRYESNGFLIHENSLIPNLDKLADQIRFIFDVNKQIFVEKKWRDYGFHLIGYEPRKYLTDLIISEKSQLNFYQGMIKQKGSIGSLQKLLRSEYVNKISDIIFYEEWLFRIGHYGNYENIKSFEIIFDRNNFKENPNLIDFSLEEISNWIPVSDNVPNVYIGKYFFNTDNSTLYRYNEEQKLYEVYNFGNFIKDHVFDNPYDNILRIFMFVHNGVFVGGSDQWLEKPNIKPEDWLFITERKENTKRLPNAGYVKNGEFDFYAFNKNEIFKLYSDKIKNSEVNVEDGMRLWVYDTSLMLNSKFNQPLDNFYDAWSIFRFSEYFRKISNISLKENGDIAISFIYSEIFETNDSNRYKLNVENQKENEVLVSFEEKENRIEVSNDNVNVYGNVYVVDLTSLPIVSGQSIIISYRDEIYPNSLNIIEFYEYNSLNNNQFITKYKPLNLDSISFGTIVTASSTYVGNLSSFSVYVSSLALTGESVWITYSPIIDSIQEKREYTEKFISDGINNVYNLKYLPNISSIKVRKGFEINVSADKYIEERNPYIQVSSNIFNKVWIEYQSVGGDRYIEIFEKTSSVENYRIKYEPIVESIVVYAGSARETKFLQPFEEYEISGGNNLIVKVSSPQNSNIFINYLIKDPRIENIPINSFVGDGTNNVFYLTDPLLLESDILVFQDGKLKYNLIDYKISADNKTLIFFNTPHPGSKIWVYYVSNIENFSYQVFLSSQTEIDLPNSGLSTFGCLVTLNDEILKPVNDYVLSGKSLRLNVLYPYNSVLRIRFINPVPAIKEKDIILFDYSNIIDSYPIEGFREVKHVNNLGEIIIENTNVNNLVFIDKEGFNQPRKIFILKEIRFRDYEDYFNTINSPYFSTIFGAPKKGEIIYIDDARSLEEKNLVEKYYRVFRLPDKGWFSVKDVHDIIKNTIRKQDKKIDTSLIYNAEIYDLETNNKILVEVYDPYKGIIPGVADREIFYKLDYDPAIYNEGNPNLHNISKDSFWSSEQVGRVWWDLRTVRFMDYELGENDYRRSFWGKIAPGTTIDVYEWVRSEYPPDEYNSLASSNVEGETDLYLRERPTGITYLPGETPYSVVQEYDNKTGQKKKYYYFWVKNKITVPKVGFRQLSVFDIAKIIENPTQRGIPWFSPVSKNSLIIANVYEYLKNNKTSLRINWIEDPETYNKGNFHKQWILGRENDPNWVIDDILYLKFVDSLVGYNIEGKEVPDERLNENEKYGNLIRPRQSWFKNRKIALFNFVELVNKIFESINLTLKPRGFSDLMIYDPEPDDVDFVVNDLQQRDFLAFSNIIGLGQTVLVNKNPETANFWTVWKLVDNNPYKFELVKAQKYDLSDFIEYADFYDSSVDKNNVPEKTFNNIQDRDDAKNEGRLVEGDLMLIRDVAGFWEWQRYENNKFITVAKQLSTIKLSHKFYTNNVVYGINETWNELDVERLVDKIKNRDGRYELRKLLEIFKNGYFDNNAILNKIFFGSVRYSISENKVNDWVIKSSYVLFGGLVEILSQDEILRPSLFNAVYDYLMEIKPYHTKFRDLYKRLSSNIDKFSLMVSDHENENYDPDKTRKIKIKQVFDRVSCSEIDNEPSILRIFSNGLNSSFTLKIDGINIVSIPPVESDYEIYKQQGPQKWSTENIEYVAIKNDSDLTYRILSENEWKIDEIQNIVVSGNSAKVERNLQLNLSFVPKRGDIIEIKRRLFAADRISRYYEIITHLINGKPVSNILPEKSFKLISGCDFSGTQVEGGNFVYSISNFQLNNRDSFLKAIWDLKPNENFIKDNILSPTTPNGGNIYDFISLFGDDWLDVYYEIFSNTYPNDPLIEYLNSFYEIYSWDNVPWDGEEGIISDQFGELIYSSAANLYDTISESGTQLSGFPEYVNVSATLSSWPSIQNYPIGVVLEGNKFVQPYYGPNRPEELILNRYYDPIIVETYTKELPGACIVKEYKFKGILNSGFEIHFDIIPQSREAIFFFVNGQLKDENEDYIIDWRNQKIVYIGPSINDNDTQILLKIYSTGGNKLMHTQYFKVSDATTGTYGYKIEVDKDIKYSLSAENIFATIDGYVVSALDVINGEIFFDLSGISVSSDSNVIINIYEDSEIVKIRTKKYILNSGNSMLNLFYQPNNELPLDHSLLVYSSGLRIHGPDHMYFVGNNIDNLFELKYSLSSLNFVVFVDNVIQISGLDYILKNDDNVIEFTNTPKKDSFIVIQVDNGDYITNLSGNLIIKNPISGQKTFKIITFNNNRIQGTRVEKFNGNNVGIYELDLKPIKESVFWVSIDGYNQIYGIDFTVAYDNYGYDQGLFGIQDYGEGPEYSEIIFNSNHSGKSIYVLYSIKEEKQKPYILRLYQPLYQEKEFNRISHQSLMYLKTDISSNSTFFDVYENYRYIPGLLKNPLTKPNPQENIPGVVWINGERIEYWNLSKEKYDSENRRYWTISGIIRRTKESSRGVSYRKETYWFAGDNFTTSFVVPTTVNLSAGNVIVTLYHNEFVENYWDDVFGWDYSPFEIIPENVKEDIIQIQTSSTPISSLSFTISGNTILFNQPVPESNLNEILQDVSAVYNPFYPLKNIKVDVIIYDWSTKNIEHEKGSVVINGNIDDAIPGYSDQNIFYDNSNIKTVSYDFLKNRRGNNLKP